MNVFLFFVIFIWLGLVCFFFVDYCLFFVVFFFFLFLPRRPHFFHHRISSFYLFLLVLLFYPVCSSFFLFFFLFFYSNCAFVNISLASPLLLYSYPEVLLEPASVTDDVLMAVSRYRSRARIPTVVWQHPRTFASLSRCSQPKVGLLGNKSKEVK